MRLADKMCFELVRNEQRNGYQIVLPNFYLGRYEMDVFKRLKSGYINEYEIKTSRSDFLKDFKKYHSVKKGEYPNHEYKKVYKHDLIQSGDYPANRFNFVAPKGLVELHEIPDYAGFIEYHKENGFFKTIKSAPLIHQRKLDSPRFIERLAISCAFREMSFRQKNYRLKSINKDLSSRAVQPIQGII